VFSRVLVALGLNPIAFPQCSWLPANLPGMEGLLFGGFDALADRVIRVVHMGSKSSQRRDSMSHHPSPCRKPEDMAVLANRLRYGTNEATLDQPLLQFLVHLRRIAT